ncbi:MAG TPA: SGNH/GDSL hydrolase family protein [Bryobacteraceae bacterium]|nr:SGNH/GDSL hydrolase family protein [Bryobacteraceae bacterium]
MRRELRAVAFLIYNCAILCVVFGAAEYTARAIQSRRFGANSQRPEALRDRWTAIRNNPAYGRPGVVHNAQGFRRAENVEVVKPVNTVRIFLLGGSVTYGGESLYPEIESRGAPRNDETIDYYLERRLNREFPSKRWQVINAGVKGYLLNQDLALLLSTVVRYQPDYVISLDGVNDLSSLLRAPSHYDSYLQPELVQDFNRLANPSSLASLRAMPAAWLRNDSVLFYSIQNWLSNWNRRRARAARARQSMPPSPLQFSDLTAQDQEQYRISAAQLESLLKPVRFMHAVLAEEGIEGLFALQPEILLSHKPWIGSEQRLLEYHRKLESRVFLYGFENLYPELGSRLRDDARERGYSFLDLTKVFDDLAIQSYTDYCHLTQVGNSLIADQFFKELRASFQRTAATTSTPARAIAGSGS